MVLAVDDDPDVLATISHMLHTRGFRVLTALDTETALTVCQQEGGAIDVLLADLSLPGDLSGRLAQRVSSEFPSIKIIYVTGVPRFVALGSGLVRPDAPYLEKPVNPDALTGLIRRLLAESAREREQT
ncbi:response regulator [Actinoplanes sp. M2I2]|uniref:response regulator n=1 Tax=Actinoplanes sp. M2I2 TaxID=1734444 RepID=UPI0020218FC5|nr:response regulator [Actinoplanes sp. M2I2]